MFSFDGDFRRRPQQNLGGASQEHARDEVIRKAQSQRYKREEKRRRETGAVVIQSYVRSFLWRQRIKKLQRKYFDDYLMINRGEIKTIEDLTFLLRRILFFYCIKNPSDCERLIKVAQSMLKNPAAFITIASSSISLEQQLWQHRIKKLLALCLDQIFIASFSPAIPFRILEIFTSYEEIVKNNPEDTASNRLYLANVFRYLTVKNFYKKIRRLIDERVPPTDGSITAAPDHMSGIIFELLIRPLRLVQHFPEGLARDVMYSFTSQILSPEYTDPIKNFILPTLATRPEFPYAILVRCLSEYYQNEIDAKNTIIVDSNETEMYDRRKKKKTDNEPVFSAFLLCSILRLDNLDLENCSGPDFARHYIKVIASMSDNISKLPIKSLRPSKHDDSSDSDSDGKQNQATLISAAEREILAEIIQMLNESKRIGYIVDQVSEGLLTDSTSMHCICQICHDMMTHNKMAVYEYELLYMLAFKPTFIRTLWNNLTQLGQTEFTSPISLLSKGLSISKYHVDQLIPLLATFCALFGRLISTLHDGEFCQEDVLPGAISKVMPFTLSEIVQLSTTLKEVCLGLVELAFPETRSSLRENYRDILSSFSSSHSGSRTNNDASKSIWPHLLKVCVSLLRQLHTRDLRRGFCQENHWTAQALNLPLDKPTDLHLQRSRRGPRPFQPIQDFTRDDIEDGPPLSIKQIRSITILREIPFVVPFNTRVGVLQGLLTADKLRTQGDHQGFLMGPSITIQVRRSHIYEDAFDKLSIDNEPDLRPRFRVQMKNHVGLDEAGIDGGGVFREFLSETIKAAFDPHRGFFLITTDNKLYPNPSVGKITENFKQHYFFIGRILGKALYENLLVELPLAEFFLTKLAGKHSDVDVHQLASLDPMLHKNLLSLKAYEGDVADLGLYFTIDCDELGETREEDLKPNGANIPVTSANRLEYIQLMADFKLNKQIREQCMAFRRGLSNVLPLQWLYMFSNKELQVLISGAEIPVDIDDLRQHTRYNGDFSTDHMTIVCFWRVLEEFSDIQRRLLLKFVTSCSRPPLLGFKDLDPPFCIQNAGDMDRLPSASTCMNLLKLPAFDKEDVLRERLLYAIESDAGFELS